MLYIKMFYFQSLFFIIIQKKKNFIKVEIHLSGFYTKFMNYFCSIDNGMSRCMFINANLFNCDFPVVFFKYFFKV
jgi:hypothetical protein